MFNLGRFNLVRFNLMARQEEDIALVVSMPSSIHAMVANGQNTMETVFSACLTQANLYVGAGTLFTAAWHTTISRALHARVNHSMAMAVDATMAGEHTITLTAYPVYAWSAPIEGWMHLGSDYHFTLAPEAAMAGYGFLSVDYWTPAMMLDALWLAQATTKRFDLTYIDLNLSIPPGKTLILDSENYVALLDGEDVIWAHSGGWLRLKRTTFDVQVRPASGQMTLDKTILYTEKWV